MLAGLSPEADWDALAAVDVVVVVMVVLYYSAVALCTIVKYIFGTIFQTQDGWLYNTKYVSKLVNSKDISVMPNYNFSPSQGSQGTNI